MLLQTQYQKVFQQGCTLNYTNLGAVVQMHLRMLYCYLYFVLFRCSLLCFYKDKIQGKIMLAIKKPPAIKQIVATSDGHCKLLSPIIALPDVQPPA